VPRARLPRLPWESTTALMASNESERMPSSMGRPRRVGARGEGGACRTSTGAGYVRGKRGTGSACQKAFFTNWTGNTGTILVRWSTRATEMRPSPPHRRELASWNENTVTRAEDIARRVTRVRRRASDAAAAKIHSWRRRAKVRRSLVLEPPLRRHSLLGHRHLQLGQPGLCRGALRSGDVTAGQSAVSVGRARSTRVERTRSDLPIVGASVGSGRGGGVRRSGSARVRGRTWSASILWLLQISSLSLYIEMPLAHAKPKAKDVIRVPNILVPTLGGVFSSRSPRTRARSRLPSSASSSSSTRGSGA